LYSCASVGFYDKEFFDNAIGQFLKEDKIPSLRNLGYLVQAMALLRKSDHTAKLMEWVGKLTKEQPEIFLKPSKDLSDSEFSFAQILQGLAFISPSKDLINEHLKPFLDFYYHQLSIDLSQDHFLITPSLAWSLLAFDLPLSKSHQKFYSRVKSLLSVQELSKLSFSDLVLINQLTNNHEVFGKSGLSDE
jgi:hypothetical protein